MSKEIFSATDLTATNSGTELYGTDGTPAGTGLIDDIVPGTGSSSPFAFHTDLTFTTAAATVPAGALEFVESNGTAAGTVLLDSGMPGTPSYQATANTFFINDTSALFVALDKTANNFGNELYVTDGTAAGTKLLKDINPGSGNSNPFEFTLNGPETYFIADDGTHGDELWVTDGTTAGTVRLDPASNGNPASYTGVGNITNLGPGEELFTATDATATALGRELYVTDGTASGTHMVADLNAGPGDSNPMDFQVYQGKAYFEATDAAGNLQTYVTDGTAAGTIKLDPSTSGTDSYVNTGFLTHVGNDELFVATDLTPSNTGTEVYVSDGTAAGTKVLKDINPGAGNSAPSNFTVNGNRVFFTANDGTHGFQVYVTDGTTAGTIRLDAASAGDPASYSAPTFLTDLSPSKELFVATDNTATNVGNELYVTDGTAAGTSLLADLNTGVNSSNPSNFEVSNGHAFFLATDAAGNTQVYATDGTAGGTVKLDGQAPALGDSYKDASNITLLGNKVVFEAVDLTAANTGAELYVSDGTAAGTHLLKDIEPGSGSSNPMDFTVSNGDLYFEATDGVHGVEAYVTDGTTAGTLRLDSASNADPGSYAAVTLASGTPLVTLGATTLAADTGASATDGITNNGKVTVSGTVLTNAGNDAIVTNGISGNLSVDVFDGTKDLGTATVSADTWSLTTTLGEGTHTLTAVAVDDFGNRNKASATSSVTVDTTAPLVAITAQAVSPTTPGAVTVTGTVENVPGTTVDIFDGATKLGAATVSNGTFSFSTTLAAGTHSLKAVATDIAGNTTTTAPEPTLTTSANLVQTGGPGNDFFTVHGTNGPDQIDGGGGNNFIGLSQAAGTGPVVVDLKDGYVTKGGVTVADIKNIIGVNLGADTSTILGLSSGVDLIYNGTGADTFYGEGATDYIQGGSFYNAVVGGSGNEIFFSNGGYDVMRGGSAANFMQGGKTPSSTDLFYGTSGNDFVYGEGGAITLVGGTGNEFLAGGSGVNQLFGAKQADAQGHLGLTVLAGTNGTDLFTGGIGTNLFYEGSGTDIFSGSSGTDLIYGGAGASAVYAGSGTDVVTTGTGSQYVTAGSGHVYFNDIAASMHAGSFDQINNFSGGTGTDVYMPTAVGGTTSFVSQNGGTAILTTVAGGTSEVFAGNASVATVQAHTHFTL